MAGVAAALAEAGAFEQLQAWVQDIDAPEDRLEIALVVVEVCVDLALADEAE